MNAQQKAFQKLSKLTADQVKEMIVILNDDFQDGATDAFNWALSYLEGILPEDEFVTFCDSL